MIGGLLQSILTRGGQRYLVAARIQVDAQGTPNLRVVVDDQHAHQADVDSASRAAAAVTASSSSGSAGNSSRPPLGRVITMVSPPPGVSSASSVPLMASTKPRDKASPSPTP